MTEEAAKNLTVKTDGEAEAEARQRGRNCPVFTVNGNTCGANAAAVRELYDVDYMKFGIDRDTQKLYLIPCDAYDIKGFKWVTEKEGKRVANARTGLLFVLMLCREMNWNPGYRHRIPGEVMYDGVRIYLSYDLRRAVHFPRGVRGNSAAALEKWAGPFCPAYADGNRSFEIRQLGKYAVWMILEEKRKDGEESEKPEYENGI